MRFQHLFLLLGFAVLTACAAPTPQADACTTTLSQAIPNSCVVTDGVLWRGSKPNEQGASALIGLGVKTVVNLELLHDDMAAFQGALPAAAPAHVINYFRIHEWEPNVYVAPAVLDDHVAEFLAIMRTQAKPVYVHCRSGQNRTGVMVAAYRIFEEGMPVDPAIDEMRKFRGVWFAQDATYLRGLAQDRRDQLLQRVAQKEHELKPDAQLKPAPSMVVDVPTRPDVTQRMLVLTPAAPKAAVVLLPGGHGGLQIAPDGTMKSGNGNFLVRNRQLFADQGLMVAVLDAPSDHQQPPYLANFRQTPEHASDIKAVMAWLREKTHKPVWLVGTSRGTQSAAYVATVLSGSDGPDGIVLTSTILTDRKSRPVPAMPLDHIRVPVLVVHHKQDGCSHCSYADAPLLLTKLVNAPKTELLSFTGGQSTGDPCEAFAYHGFNGLEPEVVKQISDWILAR